MRVNPIMSSMVYFNPVVDGGHKIFENDYPFVAGPVLKQLEDFPPGSYFYVSNEESLGVRHIDSPVPGWRIKVGPYYLYLLFGEEDAMAVVEKKSLLKLHRLLMKEGWYYPDTEDIKGYWRAPEDDFNNPKDYFKPEERSELLTEIIKKINIPLKSALELGCNVGRNINYLREKMNLQVGGLEINEEAVALLRENYPSLAKSVITTGDLTQTIHNEADGSYDLIFSMAVLMHLHPATESKFWDKVATVARKLIITIENEQGCTERNWPRNYKTIFEARSWTEIVYYYPIQGLPGLDGYTIRAFYKQPAA